MPEKIEPYSYEKAREEADKIEAKIKSGEANDYSEAELLVEQPKLNIEFWENTKEAARFSIDKNHDWVIYEDPNHPKADLRIVIQNSISKEYELDFGSFVKFRSPRNVSFEPVETGNNFAADIYSWGVRLPSDLFKTRSPDVFAILHEIGHLIDFDEKEADQKGIEEYDRVSYILANLEKMNKNGSISIEDANLILKSERIAWAKAIRLARGIRREYSVDLFSLFGGADEFMGWLRSRGLRSYEGVLEKLGQKAFTKSEQVDAWMKRAAWDWEKMEGKIRGELKSYVYGRM